MLYNILRASVILIFRRTNTRTGEPVPVNFHERRGVLTVLNVVENCEIKIARGPAAAQR